MPALPPPAASHGPSGRGGARWPRGGGGGAVGAARPLEAGPTGAEGLGALRRPLGSAPAASCLRGGGGRGRTERRLERSGGVCLSVCVCARRLLPSGGYWPRGAVGLTWWKCRGMVVCLCPCLPCPPSPRNSGRNLPPSPHRLPRAPRPRPPLLLSILPPLFYFHSCPLALWPPPAATLRAQAAAPLGQEEPHGHPRFEVTEGEKLRHGAGGLRGPRMLGCGQAAPRGLCPPASPLPRRAGSGAESRRASLWRFCPVFHLAPRAPP